MARDSARNAFGLFTVLTKIHKHFSSADLLGGKHQYLCLCPLIELLVWLLVLNIAFSCLHCAIVTLFAQFTTFVFTLFSVKMDIDITTVLCGNWYGGHFYVSAINLVFKGVRLSQTTYFTLQIVEREKQSQTARKGPVWIFSPFL